jgi:hypothetical protein
MLDTRKKENENTEQDEEPIENPGGIYDIVVKNKNLENEIKNMVDHLNFLMKSETDRIFAIYSEMILDEKTLQKFKNILTALFGLKESEKKIEAFLKMLNEIKVIFIIF